VYLKKTKSEHKKKIMTGKPFTLFGNIGKKANNMIDKKKSF
tara:strand:+ start:627 stop:749 length:123 start_codon:yes stop_codon:yes gene_type:complete